MESKTYSYKLRLEPGLIERATVAAKREGHDSVAAYLRQAIRKAVEISEAVGVAPNARKGGRPRKGGGS